MTPKVAVVGLFYYEYFYIPLWQNYYGNLFGYNNLFALGDLKNDFALKLFHDSVNLINYSPEFVGDHDDHIKTIINLQKQLLENYDVVIFAEADQFFVPDPDKYLNLNDYLHHNTQDYIKVSGWNVRHRPEKEPYYNPTKRILEQRNYWFKDPGPEDKQVIIRKPMNFYHAGFHVCDPNVERDPDLINIHLQKFDFNLCNSRNYIRTSAKNWHPGSGKHGMGSHVFKYDEELYNDWLQENQSLDLQLIPEKYKILNLI
jgi:hypothetical protein